MTGPSMAPRWTRLVFGMVVLSVSAHPGTAQQTVAADRRSEAETADERQLLARPVTVSIDKASVKTAVKMIAASAGIRLQYRDDLLDDVSKVVTLHANQLPLGTALERVLADTRLQAAASTSNMISIKAVATGVAVDGVIVGTITDAATRRPVMGATLALEKTRLVGRTDDHGAFRLASVPAGTYTLTVRRLGYVAARRVITVTDNSTATIDIALVPTATQLEQVVTTVTGPQRRLELGNVVGVIRADSLVKEAPITTLSQLLSSRVPGLVVSQGQGTVGGNVKVQIRGLTSLSLQGEPIVIVDGVRFSSRAAQNGGVAELVSPLNDLNPNDIETVEVVKGPSAATLYGTDAAHGVIVVTTKRGKVGAPQWNTYAKGSRDVIPTHVPYPDRYLPWPSGCYLYLVANGGCTLDSVTVLPNALADARTSVLHPAKSWGSGASVSGGQSSVRYFFSGNYDDLTGAVALPPALADALMASRGVTSLPDEWRRPNTQTLTNLRSNIDATLLPQLQLSVNGGYTHGDTRAISVSSDYSPFARVFGADPRGDGALRAALDQIARTSTEGSDRFVASAHLQGRWASWLATRATAGIDAATRNHEELFPRDSARIETPEGSITETRVRQVATSGDVGATGTFNVGRWSSHTSVGGQYVRTLVDGVTNVGYDVPSGATSVVRAGTVYTSQNYNETVTLGTYVEQMLALNERLFLTGAVRVDGGSAFGSGYHAAAYPKVSASWLVSREPFLPRVPGLDELRFRAALGASGQQPLATWALPEYAVADALYEGPDLVAAGYGRPTYLVTIGNPLLKPERGREIETGFDAGVLGGRGQVELTWYHRRTTDQISFEQLPAGFVSRRTNLGLTTEHGVEAQVTATLLDTRSVHWQLTLQHATTATKLVHIGDAYPFIAPEGGYAEGYPLGARFIAPIVGFDDANHDGIIAASEIQYGDSVYAGQGTPSRTQTVQTTVGLWQQRIRLSALIDRQAGFTVADAFNYGCFTCRYGVDPTSPLAEQASNVATTAAPFPGYRHFERGDFTRLREVTAAFTLPTRLLRPLRAHSGTLSLSARNLGLWTHFTGPDPEATPQFGGDPTNFSAPTGIPQSRTWSLRCDFGW